MQSANCEALFAWMNPQRDPVLNGIGSGDQTPQSRAYLACPSENANMSKVAHDTPSEVVAHQGEVHIDGPGSTALALTPDAAIETADRLLDAATMAHGQRILAPARKDEI